MNTNVRLLTACVAGFALGVLVTSMLPRPPQPNTAASSAATQATSLSATSSVVAATTVDALVQQVLTIEETQTNDPFALLERKLNEDPAARARVFDLYEQQTLPQKKARLRMMLSFVPQPDLLPRVQAMLASENPAQRSEAYVFLRIMQEHTPAAHELLLQALSSEKDEDALVQAIDSLAPQARPTIEKRKQIISLLEPFQQADSTKVRAAALVAICRWDTRDIESRVTAALNDASPDLRSAAVGAALENAQQVKTARVKAALMQAVNDDALDPRLRGMVTELLQGYDLTTQEEEFLAKIQQSLRAQMPKPN